MRLTLATAVTSVLLTIGTMSAAFGVVSTMGNAATDRGLTDSYRNFTIVDTNNPAPFDGVFDEITYYAGRTGDVRFVVVDSEAKVTWISDVVTAASTGVHTVALPGLVGVTSGSNLGVYSVVAGVVSYEYATDASGAAWEPNNAGQPAVGETLAYERTDQGRYYSMNTTITATSPEICKNDGWAGYGYKNQGECIASVVANDHAGKE